VKKAEPTRQELIQENETLKERLWEADQTIKAIRGGEVDAFVIQESGEEQIYTLKGADAAYRILVESLNEGALILASDDSIFFCNGCFSAMVGLPIQKIIGSHIRSFFIPDSQTLVVDKIRKTRKTGVARGEAMLERSDGIFLPVSLSLNFITMKDFQAVCAIVTDLSEQKQVEEELRRHRTELEFLVNERTSDLQQEIIERKRAEEEVRGQREWLRVTLTSIGEAVIATDAEARITFMNPVAAALTGWREEEARGKLIQDVFTIINEKTRKPTEDVVRRVLHGGRVALLPDHIALVTRDGREIPIEDSAAPIRNSAGNMTGVVLVFHDVIQKRRAEDETRRLHAAIQQERDTLSALVSSMPDEVWFADAQKKFTLANPLALREFALAYDSGIDVEELVASLEVFRADGSPRIIEEAPALRSLKGEVVKDLEEIIRSPASGELRYRQVSSSPVRDPDGNMIGSVSVVRDITERKKMEEELRKSHHELEMRVLERTAELSESERKFRNLSQEFHTILHAINDTLILFSPEMEVLWTNVGKVFELNETASDAVGQYCHKLVHDRSVPAENSAITRCFETAKEDLAVVKHSGAVLDIRAFPIKEAERVSRVLLLVSDITEKMAMQAEAMQAAHMASLGELAAGVAHEINNPITGIINYGQILINECSPESMEHDIGERIVKAGERIGRIVKTLLSFARNGREGRKPVRISAVLEESIILIHGQILKEGIGLRIEISDDLPEVKANFQQLEQCFINIINNARYALNEKYPERHENKRLEITGERVIISERMYVRTVIYDQGMGIPAHEFSMLAKPFFSTKPFGKGTGLGLNITKKIITDHDGYLSFESTKGEFTRVIIDLPADRSGEWEGE
jgi:PAS domain S-box-containing protein